MGIKKTRASIKSPTGFDCENHFSQKLLSKWTPVPNPFLGVRFILCELHKEEKKGSWKGERGRQDTRTSERLTSRPGNRETPREHATPHASAPWHRRGRHRPESSVFFWNDPDPMIGSPAGTADSESLRQVSSSPPTASNLHPVFLMRPTLPLPLPQPGTSPESTSR